MILLLTLFLIGLPPEPPIVDSISAIELNTTIAGTSPSATQSDKLVDFESEVWPILRDRCIRCHGSNKQEGGLRLDSLNGLHAGGDSGAPMVGESSDIVRRISLGMTSNNRMPSDDKSLSPEQIAAIKGWIEQGAKWSTQAETTIPETESISDSPTAWFDSATKYTIGLFIAALVLGTLILIAAQRKILHQRHE